MTDIKALTPEKLAGMIDQTCLKSYISEDGLRAFCEEAIPYRFKTLAVNNAVVPFCKRLLEGTGILCDAAISFPFGQSTIETKVFETRDIIGKGAGEIDYVCNIVKVKSGDWSYIEEEMRRIVEVCNEHDMVSKVIFENCYLTDDEKKRLCQAACKVRPTFVKTATGFGTGGATVHDISLMKACVGRDIKIKASGGVRTTEQALKMIEAGAERIGTSCGIDIVEGFRKM